MKHVDIASCAKRRLGDGGENELFRKDVIQA